MNKQVAPLLFPIFSSLIQLYTMDNSKKTNYTLTPFWQNVSTKTQSEKDAIAIDCFLKSPELPKWGWNTPNNERNYQIEQALHAGVDPYLGNTLKPSYPLFWIPFISQDNNLVKLFLELGVDPNKIKSPRHLLLDTRTKNMAQLLLKHGIEINSIKNTAFLLDDDTELAQFYIRNNLFDFSWIKDTSLTYLIDNIGQKKDVYPTVSALIAAGAKPRKNLFSDLLTKKFNYWLEDNERPEICNFIKLQVNARNAALFAIRHGNIQRIIKIVETCPAMVNATDYNGNSLLHYTIMIKDKKIAYQATKFLMSKGAWINKQNISGISPFALACDQRKKEIVFMILPFVSPQEIDYQIQDHCRKINFILMLQKRLNS